MIVVITLVQYLAPNGDLYTLCATTCGKSCVAIGHLDDAATFGDGRDGQKRQVKRRQEFFAKGRILQL